MLIGLLVVAAVLITAAFAGDDACIRWMQAHQHRQIAAFASKISEFGDWPELMVYGLIAVIIAWARRAHRTMHLILCMMLASTLAGVAVNAVRALSGRARPGAREVTPGWYGPWKDRTLILHKNKFHSFPSGHTACAFAFFGTVAWARPRWGWLLLGFAGSIAWSRLYLNAHHLSDVTVAALFGLWLAYVTWSRAGPPIRRWLDTRVNPPQPPPPGARHPNSL